MRNFWFIALLAFVWAAPLSAQDRSGIGTGRLFSNDLIGDGSDRWRTGSYVISHVRAPRPFENSGFAMGELLEYRLRGEIIAPSGGSAAPGDRPYAGALSFGVHTHFDFGLADVSLGADVVAIGPQTGLSRFQTALHDALDMPDVVHVDEQLGNAVYLGGTLAVGTQYHVSDRVLLRPFAEAQIGVEDLVRVGGDLVIGAAGQDGLMLRDVVTGQLYRGTQGSDSGLSYVLGADVAAVNGSVFLPDDAGRAASETRARARAGVHYQSDDGISLFYGLTYLSEEFTDQAEGQVIGSLNLNFSF